MNFDSNNRTHVIGAGIGAAVAIIGAILLFTGGEKVSRSVVDDNQVISQRNSQQNLNTFMAMTYPDGIVHPQFGKPISAVTDSDSTIRENCRFGDGWASGRINFASGTHIKMKCQTDGRGKGMNGCLSEAEFMKKEYKDQEGTCQNLTELPKFK